jgi:hypothetical protein
MVVPSGWEAAAASMILAYRLSRTALLKGVRPGLGGMSQV